MFKNIFFCSLLGLFIAVVPFVVQAEDAAEAQDTPPAATAEKDPLVEAQEKSIKKTHGLLVNLVNSLEGKEQKHFYMMYNNYNLIGTAQVVRGDVENAIQKCGEHNPEMKEELDTRYEAWNGEIMPALEEAEGHLDNMVVAQDYADQKDIEKIFASIDNTREYTNERFDKVPVTTPEACEYLLGKMDETQGRLLSLLRATLVNYMQNATVEDEGEEDAATEPETPEDATDEVEDAEPAEEE